MVPLKMLVITLLFSFIILFISHIWRLSRVSYDNRVIRQAFMYAMFDRKAIFGSFFFTLTILLISSPSVMQNERFDPRLCATVADMLNTTGSFNLLTSPESPHARILITTIIIDGYQGSFRIRGHQMTDELNRDGSFLVEIWECDCENFPPIEEGERRVVIHVKYVCECDIFLNLTHSVIHIYDMVDGFWQHGYAKPYMNATFSQTLNLKKSLTSYFKAPNVFVVPHHTGISLHEVSHLDLMHSSIKPSNYWRIGTHHHGPDMLENFTVYHPSKIIETVHFAHAEDTVVPSVESITRELASLDIVFIWIKESNPNPDQPNYLYRPYQRAANAAACGIPVILNSVYRDAFEFASLRFDLKSYPYIAHNLSEAEQFVRQIVDEEGVWEATRHHALEIAKCSEASTIVKQYVHIISYLLNNATSST